LLTVSYAIILLVSTPKKYLGSKLINSILSIPGIVLSTFLIHLKLKGADKTFIHTEHAVVNFNQNDKS